MIGQLTRNWSCSDRPETGQAVLEMLSNDNFLSPSKDWSVYRILTASKDWSDDQESDA